MISNSTRYQDALNTEQLKANGITHVLTSCPIAMQISNTFTQLIISIEDLEHTNIITHFQDAIQFISKAIMMNKGVLVHCAAGISRSVTLIAAYLMSTHSLSPLDALAMIKLVEPRACPNSGFMQQLELFFEMHYTINPHYDPYKKFRITTLASEYQENGFIAAHNLTNISQNIANQTSIRCKKCRFVLALSESIIPHTISTGQSQFQYFKRDASELLPCALLFIEPMEWMGESVKGVEGKLMCPGCKCKIGAFNWYGMQCSCGSWNSPAFTIPRKVVDEMKCIPRQD